ncbi:MAG: NUDIX hydrolase [Blastocatellia bacterium]
MTRQLLDSQRMFSGRVFNIDRDRLLDVNGAEIIREVVRHNGGAGILPLHDDGTVTLARQYRHPARAELLEIPAGTIEPGEDPETCVRREIEEEIGLRPGIVRRLSAFYPTPGFCEEKLHVFLGTQLTPVPQRLDHDEVIEVVRLPLSEALALVHDGQIVDAKTIIALLLTGQTHGRV